MRRETAYEGCVDGLEEKTLLGWCYKKDEPNKSIQLDIYINDTRIKSITASEFSEVLLKAGIGNGKCSFKYNVANYIDQDDYIINVKVSGTDIDLTHSPILVKNNQQITNKCYFPWNNLHIRASGDVDTCPCPSWLGSINYSIGNINKQSYDELWNGSKIRQYREAFLKDNHKKFCRMHICPYLSGTARQNSPTIGVLKAISNQNTYLDFDPTTLVHDIDEGCNLKCTICRENIKVVNKKAVHDAVSIMKRIASGGNLQSITTSGAGETFLFDEFVDLLRSDFLSSRGITLILMTNLTIFTPKLWKEIRHNDIVFSVSVDGATKETYESIRKDAQWESVYKQLLYLSNLLDKGEINTVNLAYVITLGNAHEVDKIIELAKKLGFTLTFLSHRGRLPTKWDNIFETCNIEKLDMIYNLIEKAGGFNMPKLFLTSCGMIKNREYRQFGYRMEMAEYQIREYGDKEMAKHIVQECFSDINDGIIAVQQSQLNNYRDFISGFLAANGVQA